MKIFVEKVENTLKTHRFDEISSLPGIYALVDAGRVHPHDRFIVTADGLTIYVHAPSQTFQTDVDWVRSDAEVVRVYERVVLDFSSP